MLRESAGSSLSELVNLAVFSGEDGHRSPFSAFSEADLGSPVYCSDTEDDDEDDDFSMIDDEAIDDDDEDEDDDDEDEDY